jgi:hypothetical protein
MLCSVVNLMLRDVYIALDACGANIFPKAARGVNPKAMMTSEEALQAACEPQMCRCATCSRMWLVCLLSSPVKFLRCDRASLAQDKHRESFESVSDIKHSIQDYLPHHDPQGIASNEKRRENYGHQTSTATHPGDMPQGQRS